MFSNDVITVVGRVLIAATFPLSGLSNRWLSHNNGRRARVFVSTRAAYRGEPPLERPLWYRPPSSESRTIWRVMFKILERPRNAWAGICVLKEHQAGPRTLSCELILQGCRIVACPHYPAFMAFL